MARLCLAAVMDSNEVVLWFIMTTNSKVKDRGTLLGMRVLLGGFIVLTLLGFCLVFVLALRRRLLSTLIPRHMWQ
jgi:hypothetical protein